MRRTLPLWILALSLAVGACDSGTEPTPEPTPEPVAPKDLRLQIVSGAHQTARIGGGASASLAPVPGLSLQELPEGLLPEPLVARVVTRDGGMVMMSEVAAETIVVTYRVIPPADIPSGDPRHCGASFIDSQAPDADGHVTTYWEEPTIADYDCRMEMRLVVDGVPRVDTVFTSRMAPGPVATFEAPDTVRLLEGEVWRVAPYDRFGNYIPETYAARGDALVAHDAPVYVEAARWGAGEYDVLVADTVIHTGTILVYPDLAGEWLWELACEAPSGSYLDRIVFQVATSPVGGGWSQAGIPMRIAAAQAAGVDPTTTVPLQLDGISREVLAGTDTLFALDSGTYDFGSAIIAADTTALIWPLGGQDPYRGSDTRAPTRWIRTVDPTTMPYWIEGLPRMLPLVGTEPRTWRSEDAKAACISDGWTDATAGSLTVRPAD